jgi:hypothetical protein
VVRKNQVTFEWTAVPGAAQYLVEFTGPNGHSSVPVAGTSFSVVVPKGTDPGSYQVRVVAIGPTNLPMGAPGKAVTVVVK